MNANNSVTQNIYDSALGKNIYAICLIADGGGVARVQKKWMMSYRSGSLLPAKRAFHGSGRGVRGDGKGKGPR